MRLEHVPTQWALVTAAALGGLGVDVVACGGTSGREGIPVSPAANPDAGSTEEGSNDASVSELDATILYVDAARLWALEDAVAVDASAGDSGPDYQAMCDQFLASANTTADGGLAPFRTVTTTCTGTELVLYEVNADGLGDGGFEAGACLECALDNYCIDDLEGDMKQECDDLADAATAPNPTSMGVGPTAVAQCLATLRCELGAVPPASPPPLCVNGSCTLANALCGSVANAQCQMMTAAVGFSGACAKEIEEGLPSIDSNGTGLLTDIANNLYPTGQAGALVACLINSADGCPSCFR
jgi:hypothetical protein